MSNSDDQVFTNWAESAAFWDKHRESRHAMFGPITKAMCREAGVPESAVVSPYVVLDVAAGTGDVSIELAETLGNNATVWCTDMVPEMVKIAGRNAAASGMSNVLCRESLAENLPFDSAVFDAVLCRFGIMFFRDPQAGVREALRVLKPGSRVVYCVWGQREANPFHHVVQDVLDRYVAGAPPAPDAPGAFRYASPGKLISILQEAGADKVRETVFRFNLEALLMSFDKFFEIRTEMSDSLREKLRKLPEGQKSKFKSDVRHNARPYLTATGVRFPMEVILVSGAA